VCVWVWCVCVCGVCVVCVCVCECVVFVVCVCVYVGVWCLWCVCVCVSVSVCVCVCVCVTSSNFEPGDQVSQNLVRPLHNAVPVNDNSAVGTPALSFDRQLTYIFRWPLWLSRLLVLL